MREADALEVVQHILVRVRTLACRVFAINSTCFLTLFIL